MPQNLILWTNSNINFKSQASTRLQKYKVKWVLIDPKYKDNKKSLEMFEFLAKMIHAIVEVESHLDMKDYFNQPSATPDAIMAMDFEDGSGPINTQPLRDKQRELAVRGHKCVLQF